MICPSGRLLTPIGKASLPLPLDHRHRPAVDDTDIERHHIKPFDAAEVGAVAIFASAVGDIDKIRRT